MSANEGTGVAGVRGDHGPDVIEALGRYALAKGIEDGLQKAMNAVVRQLAEARLETHEAWAGLREALDEEPLLGEGWGS
jgi:hypothetical protein